MKKIVKDNTGNDILIINEKVIPLNMKNTDLVYQNIVMDYCQDIYDYEAYKIKDGLYSIKEIKSYKNYKEVKYKLIGSTNIDLYTFIEMPTKTSFLSYNSKYITVVERDYDYPINDVVAAYDIIEDKQIDCTDYHIRQELCDSVVNYKRCLYDVVASILTNQILMIDKQRLFSFMSFLTNRHIDDDNYEQYTQPIKEYIIHNYPGFKDHNIDTNKKLIMELNSIYGINYFKFKKIPYTIDNISYLQDKQLVKSN